MSLINSILNKFLKYAEKNFPELLSHVNPGLSRTEILSITQKWSIPIPHEVHKLYQWRNGCGDGSVSCFFCIFDIWGFFPLKKVTLQKQPNSDENEDRFNINYPLNTLEIFFGVEYFLKGYIIFDEKGETKWTELGEVSDGFFERKLYYTSLTNMLLTITESHETGAYYKDSRGYWTKNEEKCINIWKKYNSDELSVATLKQLYQKPNFNFINNLITDLGIFLDPRKNKHLTQILETIKLQTEDKHIREIAIRILNNARQDSLGNLYPLGSLAGEYWKSQNSQLSMFKKGLLPKKDFKIFDMLEDPNENVKRAVAFLLFLLDAVEPLIQLTTHHEAGWRRESAWALGQIGDIRATDAVNRLTQDEDSYVREAAQSALIKLQLS